jgi:predicted PurR-regulated permease PerM
MGWAIFVALWSVILVGNIDNVIRPLFVSRGSRLPLLLILIGILGGAMAFGFIGIFLGPTILAILYTLMREWSPVSTFGGRPAETCFRPPSDAG